MEEISYSIDLELMEEEFPVRGIVPREEAFWSEFKDEIALRQYEIKEVDSSRIYLDRKIFKRIELEYKTNKNDVWMYLNFKSQPMMFVFAVIVLFSLLFIPSLILWFIFRGLMLGILSDLFDMIIPLVIDFLIYFIAIYYINQNFISKSSTVYYKKRNEHVQEIKKAAQQSSDKIKREYMYQKYALEKIKNGICPSCGEDIKDEFLVCPICNENLKKWRGKK
ncbi:MAG: hypothetical protein GF329_07075 [Candidatus Lokiarchaeota archaeon]|nr:hypothetical protein [Candidatus Lokiarchaeota archaeon]